MKDYRVGTVTISDSVSQNSLTDQVNPIVKTSFISHLPYNIIQSDIIPDSPEQITQTVLRQVHLLKLSLIITSGGTGLHPTDITPETIEPLLDRKAPGIVHLLLSTALEHTPFGALARPLAGIRSSSLIICLPGSPKAVQQSLEALKPILSHALELISGNKSKVVHQTIHDTQSLTAISDSSIVDGPSRRPHDTVTCSHQQVGNDVKHGKAPRIRHSPYPMIPLDQALFLIETHTPILPVVHLSPTDPGIVNRYLLGDVYAPRDLPVVSCSNVDGYAIASGSARRKTFRILTSLDPEESVPLDAVLAVDTGGALPIGTDAMVMVEDTSPGSSPNEIEVLLDTVPQGAHVRLPGSDVSQGSLVLASRTQISNTGGEIAALASVGATTVTVNAQLKVAVLSTGTELVKLGSDLSQGKTVDSNRPALLASLASRGIKVIDLGIVSSLSTTLGNLLDSVDPPDMIISTGSTSMGISDELKTVLLNVGATIHFGRVALKPGMPTVFATLNCQVKKIVVFGLPGNPASAFVTMEVLVTPCLKKMIGLNPSTKTVDVLVEQDFELDRRPEYVRVKIEVKSGGQLFARVIGGNQRSSRAVSLGGSNGLLKLPSGPGRVQKGEVLPALVIGSIG
ncbi:hypothetical protein CROQUDRAFT_660789 [Cronartium quercuum f. sp. fusiforme G11]|uniref:molybdopterin adenylyltransferase n=1 Tax=Cronartium quercuum f. sp. fusiforme G11 TaxID=708437 RepID=A0A9P6T974_9BASI|nr:hypothetical protein CROQUDRAFT_660789 [Cronartium quercuum f. sp. fusiforme G11]